MWTKTILLGALIGLAFTQAGNDDKSKNDLTRLQGKWTMQALEINGKAVPPAQIAETTLEIDGNVYRTTVKKKQHQGLRIKLDPSKEPCEIDMIQSAGDVNKVYKGIYKIEKDQFILCRASSPENARPTEFATWPDTNYFVVTWKKLDVK